MIDGAVVSRIKDAVPIEQVCERYGIPIERGRVLHCPFHDDKHPSASLKNNRFHCYVCDLHLDVIDLTEHIFNTDFTGAVRRLNEDFGVCASLGRADPREVEKWKRTQARKEAAEQAKRALYERMVWELWQCREIMKTAPIESDWILYAGAQARIAYLDYWFQDYDEKAIIQEYQKNHPI